MWILMMNLRTTGDQIQNPRTNPRNGKKSFIVSLPFLQKLTALPRAKKDSGSFLRRRMSSRGRKSRWKGVTPHHARSSVKFPSKKRRKIEQDAFSINEDEEVGG